MIDSQAQDRGRVCSMSLIKRLPEKKNGMRLIPDAKKKKKEGNYGVTRCES